MSKDVRTSCEKAPEVLDLLRLTQNRLIPSYLLRVSNLESDHSMTRWRSFPHSNDLEVKIMEKQIRLETAKAQTEFSRNTIAEPVVETSPYQLPFL